MKILIDDGMQIEAGTGIGNYSLYLYEELKKIKNVVADLHNYTKIGKMKKFSRLKYIVHINSNRYIRLCEEYDIVHYTNYALPFRRSKKVKYVVTIHDLASFLHPESLSKAYQIYNQFVVNYAIKYADVILTVSESVKGEIINKWPKYVNKVRVAYPGYYERNKYDNKVGYDNPKLNILERNEFFLFVGTIEKRKNLSIVLEAVAEINKSKPNIKLVLAGRAGFGYEEYCELMKKLDIQENVIVTGYLSDNDIERLYENTLAYIFPTVYEGFGSTQLECMKKHTPLILSNIATNREVSDDYGLFFELDDVSGLVKQMEKLLSQNYDYGSHNIVADKIIEKFLWENNIMSYIEAYEF